MSGHKQSQRYRLIVGVRTCQTHGSCKQREQKSKETIEQEPSLSTGSRNKKHVAGFETEVNPKYKDLLKRRIVRNIRSELNSFTYTIAMVHGNLLCMDLCDLLSMSKRA